MPTYLVTDPNTGLKLRLTGDSPPTEQELESIFASQQQPEQTIVDTLGGVADVAGVAATGLGREVVEGLSGLGGLVMGKGVDESIRAAQALGEKLPKAELGEQGQQLIQSLSERFNASPEMVQRIGREFMNLGQSLGERTFQATGSPLAATAAQILPDALGAATGVLAAKAAPGAAKQVTELASNISIPQSKAKQDLVKRIQAGSTDIDTAGVEVAKSRIKSDRIAKEAIRQGFDEGVIATVKAANPADKKALRKMIDIMEGGKKNARFAATNRPSDVLGDSLIKRVNIIRKANRDAGKQLDSVANNLKGKPIDITPAGDSFLGDLRDIGININDDLTVDFKGSDIEGLTGPEAAVKRVINRMTKGTPDAYEVHRLKRFIDEQVSFGKNAEGLSGQTELILKDLRRNLDRSLDEKFPEYNRINSAYSETVGALDALQDVAGKKMNLSGPNAAKATGTLMGRILSNAQSRITLLDSVVEIEKAAKKFENFKGKLDPRAIEGPKVQSKLNDDLLTQVLFADELDAQFGAVARKSLKGQVEQAVTRSLGEQAISAAGKAAEKVLGVNDEKAFKAIRAVLNK